MKIDLNDPNLTAYGLGELSGAERSAMRKAIAQSPEAQAFVQETQLLARALRDDFRAELEIFSPKRLNILPAEEGRAFWSDARWMSIGVAALLAVGAIIAAVALSHRGSNDVALSPRKPADVMMEVETEAPASPPTVMAEPGDAFEENPFLSAATHPFSTFAFQVERASYATLRQFIDSGRKPPKDAVRLEAMINSFAYHYPPPGDGELFSITLEATVCPWAPEHRLVRIGLKAGESSVTAASVQVRFNPALVQSYRLLGYETRWASDEEHRHREAEDTEIQPGHTVTALYEIAPVATSFPAALLTVQLRYRRPTGDRIELVERSLTGLGTDFSEASADLKFAAAVAQFGMILRGSPHNGNGTLAAVLAWAGEGQSGEGAEDRAGFIELVRKAQAF